MSLERFSKNSNSSGVSKLILVKARGLFIFWTPSVKSMQMMLPSKAIRVPKLTASLKSFTTKGLGIAAADWIAIAPYIHCTSSLEYVHSMNAIATLNWVKEPRQVYWELLWNANSQCEHTVKPTYGCRSQTQVPLNGIASFSFTFSRILLLRKMLTKEKWFEDREISRRFLSLRNTLFWSTKATQEERLRTACELIFLSHERAALMSNFTFHSNPSWLSLWLDQAEIQL